MQNASEALSAFTQDPQGNRVTTTGNQRADFKTRNGAGVTPTKFRAVNTDQQPI
jgi:hypothetical protein